MTFQDYARRETASALDAWTSQTSAAVREELNALREALDARMSALEAALAHVDTNELVERLAQDLSKVAGERADELVVRTRADAQKAADARLADARAAAHNEVEAAQLANATLSASLDEARQQLTRERSANAELTDVLDEAKAAASLAHEEAKGRAVDVEAVQDRIQSLEEECRYLRQALEAAEARAVSESAVPRDDSAADDTIERVKAALRAFSGATSAQAIFDALLGELARQFAGVALFLHRKNRLEGWRSQGLDTQTNIGNVVVPLTIDSPLARAVNGRTPVAIEPGDDGVTLGVFGKPVARGVAWPVLVSGNVVAVAYVEDDGELGERTALASLQIAEILVEQVGRCLVMGRRGGATPAAASPEAAAPPSAASPRPPVESTRTGHRATAKSVEPAASRSGEARTTAYSAEAEPPTAERRAATKATPAVVPPAAKVKTPPAVEPPAPAAADGGMVRQVDRIKIRSGVEATIDGATGQLIDLSTMGAQVLSPKSIRPQQLVRLVLAGSDGPIPCKGRVMWARFEKSRPGESGTYRAGMRFTEADQAALNAFIAEYGENDLARPARTG